MKQNLFNQPAPLRWLLPAGLSLLLGLQACSKDKLCEDEPFCAKVNGKLWWPNDNGDFKAHPLTFHLIDDNNQFWIGAFNSSSSIVVGVIDSTKRIDVGNYILAGKQCCWGSYDKSLNDGFKTDSTYTGLLSITAIDRVKKTIAGTLYFKARNPATGEVVDVSHGKFDAFYSE